jgi:hypothetical protein
LFERLQFRRYGGVGDQDDGTVGVADHTRRHRCAQDPVDRRHQAAACGAENDHQGVMSVGECGQHVRRVPAVRVIGPVAGQRGQQIAGRGAFLIQRVGETLFPIVAVGINREVLEVDDVRDMQIRVQRCRQLDREAQGVMAGRTPVEPDHHMAGRATCRGGPLDALQPPRIGQHLLHRRVLPIPGHLVLLTARPPPDPPLRR